MIAPQHFLSLLLFCHPEFPSSTRRRICGLGHIVKSGIGSTIGTTCSKLYFQATLIQQIEEKKYHIKSKIIINNGWTLHQQSPLLINYRECALTRKERHKNIKRFNQSFLFCTMQHEDGDDQHDINRVGNISRTSDNKSSGSTYDTNYKNKNQNKMKRKSNPPFTQRRPLGRFITSIFKCIIVSLTFIIMKIMNTTLLHDPKNNLQKYVFERNNTDIGLLTISNHCSIIDDPGLWCGTLPLWKLTLNNIRNIIMVEESYYRLGKLSACILHGLNCLPIRRGDIRGTESPQLEELHKRLVGTLSKREWCHIMVEGRICQPWRFDLVEGNRYVPHLCKFRLGAAKLIASSPPSKIVVLPIYHYGLHNVFPETPPKDAYTLTEDGSRLMATKISGKTKLRFPRWGNHIDVYVGDPIGFTDLVPKEGYRFERTDKRELLFQINTRLYNVMLELEAKACKERLNRNDKKK